MDADLKNLSKEELVNLLQEKNNLIKNKDNLIKEKEQEISQYKELVSEHEKTIELLQELARLSRHKKFAKKSEKSPEPEDNTFDEPEEPENPDEIEKAEEEISVAAHTRKITKDKKEVSSNKKPGRRPLPEFLTRENIDFDLPESQKICKCGCKLSHIGADSSEQLEIIPARIYVKRYNKFKYACKCCNETILVAKMPKLPIQKSIAAPGLLSNVITSKYQDHLPLHRQESILQRVGIEIPRATLSNWVLKCAELLEPFYEMMKQNIINYDVAYSDETTIQVLNEPNRKPESKSYMWVFVGGDNKNTSIVYKYAPTRAHSVPLEFFKGFKGYLHCDGYAAYETMAKSITSEESSNIKLVGCWYHLRRKFVEAQAVSTKKDGKANKYIQNIKKLAAIEKIAKDKNLSADEVYTLRQEKSKPIVEKLESDLEKDLQRTLPKSLLGKALQYFSNQLPKLKVFLGDGRLDISNNKTEQKIRPFAVGRNNWFFCNSPKGAKAGAVLYSIIETCKEHSIEPYYYFKYILDKFPDNRKNESWIEAHLPNQIDKKLLIS